MEFCKESRGHWRRRGFQEIRPRDPHERVSFIWIASEVLGPSLHVFVLFWREQHIKGYFLFTLRVGKAYESIQCNTACQLDVYN